MKAILPIFIALFLLMSCKQKMNTAEDLPIAKVYDDYLYVSELENIIPQNLTEIDSLALVKDYIDKWVRKKLLVNQAEENLSEEEKDVEKQINDYRSSLLIFKYEQNIIQQKLDTTISEADIEEYYSQNSSNFILNQNLFKGLYIKVPRTSPELWKLRRWYKSDNDEHIKELDAYCFKNAKEFEYFDKDWIKFELITRNLPHLYASPKNILKGRKTIEVRDSSYYYFVRIIDYKLEGTVAPLAYVKNNIRSILLNKRKIKYINRLEAEIYNDALNRGNFNIY